MEALEICKRPVVLFDFDGTVADTGRAVMTSTRKTLAARGFSEAQMGDLRRMIGPPLWKSFHDFYGFSREEFNDVEGAHAMDVPCIGIYSGAAAPGEHEAAGADAVVHSVAELAKLFAI